MTIRPASKIIVYHGMIRTGIYALQPVEGMTIISEAFPYMKIEHRAYAPTLSIIQVDSNRALTVCVPWADTAEEESELDALIACLTEARSRIRREQGL